MDAINSDEQGYGAGRPTLIMIGVVAGLAAWVLVEVMWELLGDPRLMLFLAAGTFGFFAILMALAGPARAPPAVPLAAGIALVAAGLLWLGSWRHADVGAYLEQGYPLAAYALILLIATPFAAAALRSWSGWRDYPTLFELSWWILVRYAAAGLFVGLFWGWPSLPMPCCGWSICT